jgi:uncharacterized protein (TIGR03067 family)
MKTTVLLSLVSLFAAFTATAGDPIQDEKAIQGTWLPVEGQLAGHTMKPEVLHIISLEMDSGKYLVTAENIDRGTYMINTKATPKTLDITGVVGPNAGRNIPAIYELQGDTLKICYGLHGSPRPTEFKTGTNTQSLLFVYKRKKQ